MIPISYIHDVVKVANKEMTRKNPTMYQHCIRNISFIRVKIAAMIDDICLIHISCFLSTRDPYLTRFIQEELKKRI